MPSRRRIISLLAGSCLLAGAALGALPASAAGEPEVCVIAGTANISPGLTTSGHPFNYTFSGGFSNCHGVDSSIKNGGVFASGSGTGSCAKSTTSGTVTVTWNNGQSSTIPITTTGAGSALSVSGKVSSGEFTGKNARSALNFQANPAQCTSGITSLKFTGTGELGD